MAQQRRKLSFILSKSNHPAMDVNPAARHAKGIQVRGVNNDKAIMHRCRRQLGQQPLTQFLQIAFRIFNYVEVPAYLLIHHIAQPFFLLLTEKIGLIDDLSKYRHGTRILRSSAALLCHERETKKQCQKSTYSQRLKASHKSP